MGDGFRGGSRMDVDDVLLMGLGLGRKLRCWVGRRVLLVSSCHPEVLLLDRARTPIDLVQSVSSLYQVADLDELGACLSRLTIPSTLLSQIIFYLQTAPFCTVIDWFTVPWLSRIVPCATLLRSAVKHLQSKRSCLPESSLLKNEGWYHCQPPLLRTQVMQNVLNQPLIQDAERLHAWGYGGAACVPAQRLPLMEDGLFARRFFRCVVWLHGVRWWVLGVGFVMSSGFVVFRRRFWFLRLNESGLYFCQVFWAPETVYIFYYVKKCKSTFFKQNLVLWWSSGCLPKFSHCHGRGSSLPGFCRRGCSILWSEPQTKVRSARSSNECRIP